MLGCSQRKVRRTARWLLPAVAVLLLLHLDEVEAKLLGELSWEGTDHCKVQIKVASILSRPVKAPRSATCQGFRNSHSSLSILSTSRCLVKAKCSLPFPCHSTSGKVQDLSKKLAFCFTYSSSSSSSNSSCSSSSMSGISLKSTVMPNLSTAWVR